MTSKNMYNIDFQAVQKGSPEEVLTSFKNKKGTYARIFETLCGYAFLLHIHSINRLPKLTEFSTSYEKNMKS